MNKQHFWMTMCLAFCPAQAIPWQWDQSSTLISTGSPAKFMVNANAPAVAVQSTR